LPRIEISPDPSDRELPEVEREPRARASQAGASEPEMDRRRAFVEAHPDWIPCRLPHFRVRGDAIFFLEARRPVLDAGPALLEVLTALDGSRDIRSLLPGASGVKALARLWAAGVVTLVPPTLPDAGPSVLAIEPHPDDVALSAGGTLLLRRGAARIHVLSVVSRSNATFYLADPEVGDFDVDRITALRRQESMLAARFLQARYHTLEEPDVTIRYIDPDRYLTGDIRATLKRQSMYRHAPPSRAEVERISERLGSWILETSADEVWLPLGLGNHFDHRLTRDAGLQLASEHWSELATRKVMLYEDLPYAEEHPGTANAVVELLRRRGAVLERRTFGVGRVLEDKLECLRIYASQFEPGTLRPIIEGYARATSGNDGGYTETLWQLKRPPDLPHAPLVLLRARPRAPVDEIARNLFERRARLRRLTLLIGHRVRDLSEQIRLLARLFPNARLDVVAVGEPPTDLSDVREPRLRISLADRPTPRLLWSLIRSVLHGDGSVLVFCDPSLAGKASWFLKMIPSRHGHVFESLDDVCDLWRYWLDQSPE